MKEIRLFIIFLLFLILKSIVSGQIISQYIETNSGTTPKGIEIWNNTGSTLDFSENNLIIQQGTNGGALSDLVGTRVNSGTLEDGDVLVIGTADMGTYLTNQGLTDITFVSFNFSFNGDDALAVKYGDTITDVFGNPGEDPGTEWSGNDVSTANQNISLKIGITAGDLDGWTDPSVRFETFSTDPVGEGGLVGFGYVPGVLPVELTKFEAEYANNSVQLNWETATEVNNFGFDIERQYQVSSSEYQEWESIGLVYGHGTTNSPKYYSYIDEDLPNSDKLFYRLKQIDNDGTYAYSKTVEVDLSDLTSVDEENMQYEFTLEQNYPNPFNPVTTINFTIPSVVDANFTSTTNAVLKVYNLLGQEVATLLNEEKSAGSFQIQFDASDLPSGIYFYSLTYGNNIQTRKLALLK